MRQLLLLRHAKSSWDDASLVDFDRPLNKRGIEAARAMARHLRTGMDKPQRILCSAARRTRQTYDLLAGALSGVPVEFLNSLYETSARTLLENIRHQPEGVYCLLVIGHNPGLEELTRGLTGLQGNPEAVGRLTEKFPTGSLAGLSLPMDSWKQADWGCARLESFVRPRDLLG